jgi:predicted GNAT family acetyltransferase
MQDPFVNPYWHALKTEQAKIALGTGPARRYPADVIPFAGLEEPTPQAMTALRDLLTPGETIYVTGDQLPTIPSIEHLSNLPGWQMHLPPSAVANIPAPNPDVQPRELTALDAPAMVALTNLAFPGFFRSRTYILGHYYGIHLKGELIAMAGERLALPGFRELSAVCTHPAHTGKGHAATLIHHLLRQHAATNLQSFLHVAAANHRAITLYDRLGFTKTRPIVFHKLRRP